MEVGKDEIHIFNGGEKRRRAVEEYYKTKVSLCGKPIDPEVSMFGLITFEEAKEALK